LQAFVFLGPPGAGKGTQAKGEAERLDLLYIATGDELRRAVAQGTDLGQKAKEYMDAGELVPDDVIIGIVRDLIDAHPEARGVLFDGFPRTVAQAEALDALLVERDDALNAVVYFDVDAEQVVARLTGRRVCRQCGATYHVEHNPPAEPGVCDECGGELYQRDDDNEQTVRERLRVYGEQTASLLDYYRDRGLLVRIDAGLSIPEVREAVRAVLDAQSAA
jgi:adenylate kinase